MIEHMFYIRKIHIKMLLEKGKITRNMIDIMDK